MKLGEYAKAITSGLVAFGVSFDAATAAGSVAGEAVVANEWVRIVVATVVAGLAVFLIPNSKPEPEPVLVLPTRSQPPAIDHPV